MEEQQLSAIEKFSQLIGDASGFVWGPYMLIPLLWASASS